MCLHCLYLLTPEDWKCGEMCLRCLYPITLEVWKSGSVSGMIWQLKIGLARGEMTRYFPLLSIASVKTVTWLVSEHRPAAYFCCLFERKIDGVLVQNLTVAGLAFKKYDWRPSKHGDVLHKGF